MYGPIFCSISVDKINKTNKSITKIIAAEVGLSVLKFIGDFCGVGSETNVKDLIDNCCILNKARKWRLAMKIVNVGQ